MYKHVKFQNYLRGVIPPDPRLKGRGVNMGVMVEGGRTEREREEIGVGMEEGA